MKEELNLEQGNDYLHFDHKLRYVGKDLEKWVFWNYSLTVYSNFLSLDNIRPIIKTMREEIAFELGMPDNHYKVDKILEIFSRHNQPVMPSDEEIMLYYANHKCTGENDTSLIATVKHFLTRNLKNRR